MKETKRPHLFYILLKPLYFFLLTVSSIHANCIDDPQELEQYIGSFPRDDYAIYEVPNQGKFYIEPYRSDTIKNVLRSGQVWEPHILKTIHDYIKPGTIALDIGAHIGTFTIAMSRAIGSNGIVYAFEPQRKIFRELTKNCELNEVTNVVCHRIAIGDCQQVIEMDKETYPGSEGSTGIGRGGDFAEMRTVDSFNFTNVSLIKIDVERSEEEVLNGMVFTVRKNKPVIIIELQGGYLWESAPPNIRKKIQNSINKLQSLGYVVTRLYLHDYLALPAGI